MTKKNKRNRLIVLCGPSCVGKSPLLKSVYKFYPGLMKDVDPMVCYTSRPPRPIEKEGDDCYFRSEKFIKGLKNDKRFLVMKPRADWVAVDIEELKENLKAKSVFFEGNPLVGKIFLQDTEFKTVPKTSVYLSPLSQDEIRQLRKATKRTSLKNFIADIMRRKLLRRTRHQKGRLSQGDRDNIEVRCRSAYKELKEAFRFDHIIVNHDGEDSDNWSAFPCLIGDARESLLTFVEILKEGKSKNTEKWGRGLLG